MRLKISHRTEYAYDGPVAYALQRLKLVPRNCATQTVHTWSLWASGARQEVQYADHFENATCLVCAEDGESTIAIEAGGTVETFDKAGVVGKHGGFVPLWLYARQTALTEAGEGVRTLAAAAPAGSDLDRLHGLMGALADLVAYVPGATDASTTAEAALAKKQGVCQDHAHIFTAAARVLGFPARYVSGYLMLDAAEQAASHAWAEVHVPNLGWVGFDAANRMSPDERYVRLAVGRDYRDAMPVFGIRRGTATERLAVSVTVEQ
jgi:transglutaminase-like putative cysteine protease